MYYILRSAIYISYCGIVEDSFPVSLVFKFWLQLYFHPNALLFIAVYSRFLFLVFFPSPESQRFRAWTLYSSFFFFQPNDKEKEKIHVDDGRVVVCFGSDRVFTRIGNVLISFWVTVECTLFGHPKTLLWFCRLYGLADDNPGKRKKRIHFSKECFATGLAKTKGTFYFETVLFSFTEIFSFFT